MEKAKMLWEMASSNKALAMYLCTTVVAFITWLFTTINTNAELKYNLQYREKYECYLIETITLRATSCCDTIK